MPDDQTSASTPSPNDEHAYLRRRTARARRATSRPTSASANRATQRYARYRGDAPDTEPATARTSALGAISPEIAQVGGSSAGAGRPARARTERRGTARRPRRKWLWAAVGIPLSLLLVVVIVAAPLLYKSFNAYREIKVDSIDHETSAKVAVVNAAGTPELAEAPTEAAASVSSNEPMTILLLGVDNAEGGISRTDTIILVNIDPVAKTASMLSIPRDLKVVIPGYGIDKINAAYALGEYNQVQGGGAGLMIRTIEANLGIPIAHFAQIDFAGFEQMIDTVGGITIDVPYPIMDDEYPADNYQYQRILFSTGWQHLDGEEALIYARTRHQDGDGRRSARQQQVLLALRQKVIQLNMISKVPTLIDQFAQYTRTDVSVDEAITLARLASEIDTANITQYSLMPTLYEEQLPDSPYYLVANWYETGQVLSEFAGTEINPPGAVITNPDFSLPILIENGTDNEGLAGRVGDVLEANGFWNVDVALTEDGSHDITTVIDADGNLGTSATITSLIGVGADQITIGDLTSSVELDVGTAVAATASPGDSASYQGYAIVITLGDDAPDPAASAWQLDDYQQEVQDDTYSGGTSTQPSDSGTRPETYPGDDIDGP